MKKYEWKSVTAYPGSIEKELNDLDAADYEIL